MQKRSVQVLVVAVLIVGALVIQACGSPLQPFVYYGQASEPTQAMAAAPTSTATEVPTVEPSPTATRRALSTATPTRLRATATPTVRSTRVLLAPTATPTATPQWPAEIVLTEQQIEQMAGDIGLQGLTISGLDASFENDLMVVRADSLRYGFISIRDLVIKARPVAEDGLVTFQVESISPNNLATAAIPGLINQSLGQAFADWYVESVRVEPGQLVVTVRPR
jgi:hypothetical protein